MPFLHGGENKTGLDPGWLRGYRPALAIVEEDMPGHARTLEADLQSDSDLRFGIEGDVATVTIDRAADRNRLTPATLVHLREIAMSLAADRRTSCVVITGAGADFFSSGIFNIELRTAYSKEDALAIVRLANQAFDAIEALPQLVIGALNGAVRAGGGELALACDFRVCADHATLAFHESSYACFPGAGAPVRLPAAIGGGRALELMATGREIDAQEMLRIGLVTHVVPSSELARTVGTMAAQIAAKGPLGIRGAKRIVQMQANAGAAPAHQLSWALRSALEYSHDVDEAIAAHVQGRAPCYLGR
jgi:enoyl-CoA hydratase